MGEKPRRDWPLVGGGRVLRRVPDPGAACASPPSDDDGEDFAWLVGEIEEGRVRVPQERDIEGPAISISLGDACDVDPDLLTAICGPDGLGGEGLSPAVSATFGQDQAADVLRPSPVLAALTAQAVASVNTLTDNELIGALQAARRLEALAGYQQTVAVAEFARRRQAAMEAAMASGRPAGCRAGEFPGEELAAELVVSPLAASAIIDEATELTTRLPNTLAGMAAGRINLARAAIIAARTQLLTDKDAAYADQVLAAVAPGKRLDQLAGKAAALELKLAPEAVAARKERARKEGQRVEARREQSGNASLSGRELDTVEVMASDAYIKAIAVRLRNSGLIGGTMGQVRARVMLDLTQGRNPLDRIAPAPAPAPDGEAPLPETGQPGGRHASDDPDDQPLGAADPAASDGPGYGAGGPDPQTSCGPLRPGEPAPLPALINLLVPVGALLNWPSVGPTQAAGWGLLDREEATNLVQAAAKHPRTRWCATLIGPDGTAIAHACASGRHPWDPLALGKPPGPPCTSETPAAQRQQIAELLRGLDLTWEPVPVSSCDHRQAEPRYAPSRKLRHLLSARTQTCTAPGCGAQAVHCDVDHTVPYPDGPTCPCNTNPKCRRHHRAKQAQGWKAEQPIPGTTRWTLPSGRTHAKGPTAYDPLQATIAGRNVRI